MRSNENYYHRQPQQNDEIIASRRRLPFDSTSGRMSSSMALKRAVSNTHHIPQLNHHHDIFLHKSSSSSITEGEVVEEDGELKILDETINENGFNQSDKYLNTLTTNNRHSTMNYPKEKKDLGGTMIQELIQSNLDLKKEIRDIRRQIKQTHATNKQHYDRSIVSTNNSNKNKISNEYDDHDCSFLPLTERDYDDQSKELETKLQQYKNESTMYKQQLETCQETIVHLQKTIHSMEKRIEQLKTNEHRQLATLSNQHESQSTTNNNTDHRFIHELFHLCIKYTPRSSKLKTTVPSHHDMKTFIRQTFSDLIKTSSSSKLSANKNQDPGYFICKCSERTHRDHRPSYQYCLNIVEQCQSLFDVTCFTQLSTSLNELYYRHGELMNFKRSIASCLGMTESSRLVSCPKIIKTLQQTLDDARSNELISFKKMAKINDMNEAVSKIRSYDDFVPYYHQFIEQMANLLEVSKGDEIMPAIKTLKLLAHADYSSNGRSNPLARTSSLKARKNSLDNPFPHPQSRNKFSSQIHDNLNSNSEQIQTATDDGE